MERGIESGSGIISSLQGIGSGRPLSFSPSNVYGFMLLILYFTESGKSALIDSESEQTY